MIFRRNKYGGLFVIDENASNRAERNRKQRKERKFRKALDKLEKESSNIFTSAKGNNQYAVRGYKLDDEINDLKYEINKKQKLSKPMTVEDHNKKVFNAMVKDLKLIEKQMHTNLSEQSRKALSKRQGQIAKKYASRMRSKGKNKR